MFRLTVLLAVLALPAWAQTAPRFIADTRTGCQVWDGHSLSH